MTSFKHWLVTYVSDGGLKAASVQLAAVPVPTTPAAPAAVSLERRRPHPVLDPTSPGLKNNGGPSLTIALQEGSPAINAGDESVCAAPPVNNLDQRGYVRPGAGATRCSIGAHEYNSLPASPTKCSGDCDGSGDVTVNELITLVNIALGTAQPSACPHGVPSGGTVDVALIIQAVNNALSGG